MFQEYHKPVMIQQILDNLPKNPKICVDWTLWHAGHSLAIYEHFKNIWQNPKFFGYDRDQKMIQKAQERIKDSWADITLINKSYADIQGQFDYILLDIWVNMEHFKDESRGFSNKLDWPLDMRFDENQKFSAKDIVNWYSKQKLIDILKKRWDFDDKRWDWIAWAIISWRPFETTWNLSKHLRENRVNEQKLAVIFQVLRIETNWELNELEKLLLKLDKILSTDWIAHIITYHSIEDRQVKQFVNNHPKLEFVTKHVLKPTYQQVLENKAARSAKLRIITKI